MTEKILRIGTRDSRLALWQAELVRNKLEEAGIRSELVPVKSEGDLDLITPLYAMGVEGVFTRTLDAALLNRRIDLAVHSMKDVPIQLAQGIVQTAVLPRGRHEDVFIPGPHPEPGERIIGTGSIRRRALWLSRHPGDLTEPLRGNIQTRLRKLEESNWLGAIFAYAGLDRMASLPRSAEVLDWMLPAPAQGAIVVVNREEDSHLTSALQILNDETTALCVRIERDFLMALHGGCSAPISAYARIEDDELVFDGCLVSPDGSRRIDVSGRSAIPESRSTGIEAARNVLARGGDAIIKSIRDDQ